MLGAVGLFVRVYLLTSTGVTSALIATVGDRGCIKVDDRSICATKVGKYVSNSGWLEAGFPPTNLPDETYPLCRIRYTVPLAWTQVRFDVDEWCLKGLNGKVVVCCDKNEKYVGDVIPSPYNIMSEGSTVSNGGHSTDWDHAFPSTLKLLKDTKSSALHTLSLDSDVSPADSSSSSNLEQFQVSDQSINTGQRTEPPLVASSNINAAGFAFNLNTPMGPISVLQPAIVSENLVSDVGSPPLFANTNSPDLTAVEPDGDIAGA